MYRSGPVDYDAELRLHHEVLRRACGVQSHERVLDIGCGSGQTTCEAARMAHRGSAFGNVGRALRPAGRLVMLVWQAPERNEWDVAIRQSLAAPGGSAAVASAGPDPFSLGDPPTATGILEAAGSPTSP